MAKLRQLLKETQSLPQVKKLTEEEIQAAIKDTTAK